MVSNCLLHIQLRSNTGCAVKGNHVIIMSQWDGNNARIHLNIDGATATDNSRVFVLSNLGFLSLKQGLLELHRRLASVAIVFMLTLMMQMAVMIVPQSATAQEFAVKFSITDGKFSQILTVGVHPNGSVNFVQGLDLFCPPPPPAGSFDARLLVGGDSYFTKFQSNTLTPKDFRFSYRPSSDQGPIRLNWDAALADSVGQFEILDIAGGSIFKVNLADFDGEFIPNSLPDPSVRSLLAGGFILRVTPVSPVSVQQPDAQLPMSMYLHQNYPNPFNPSTTIRYALPEAAQVRLEVYTLTGQRVAVLASGEQRAGWHTVAFDGSALASGVYIYRLQAGGFVQTRKLMLIK
jgi:hypothetical protein